MEQQQTEGKKPKRELAQPDGDRIMSVKWETGDALEYNGKRYIKMSRIMGRPMINSSSQKIAQLWLCIDPTGTFPARTVVVPEFVK